MQTNCETRFLQLVWPVAGGALGSTFLAALYLGIVTLAESWSHAVDLLREDGLFVLPIIAGFGVQVGLYDYMRRGLHLRGLGRVGAFTGARGGTSTLAMVACCAHHMADVLPIVGISAAAVLLAEYKVWFMAVGLATTLFGIVTMSRSVRRERRRAVSAMKALGEYQ